ncbi:MAG: hypothetical protein PHI79_05200 [Sulfurovaceae bacterium]|nr:hypothetical protein [Sulfurovaceae bacterium]MDD5548978.1 hypothetical protein [Sulfurovaceae bacterium]
MKRQIKIDMTLAPCIDRAHMFIILDEDLRQRLTLLPIFLDKLENSIKFAQMIGLKQKNSFRSALVRASTTELVTIEDIQQSSKLNKSILRMNDTNNPLLCVIRELRNVDIHLSTSQISSVDRNFIWGHPDKPSEAKQISMSLYWIDNLNFDVFSKLRSFDQKYNKDEFKEALNWFDTVQREWGITELLLRTAHLYGEKLADHYELHGTL